MVHSIFIDLLHRSTNLRLVTALLAGVDLLGLL